MFVVGMCFLVLRTAALLQEEGGTLHHEEALAQAAKAQQMKRAVRISGLEIDRVIGADFEFS